MWDRKLKPLETKEDLNLLNETLNGEIGPNKELKKEAQQLKFTNIDLQNKKNVQGGRLL